MYQHQHKTKKRDFTNVPSMDNLVEVQDYLQDLFETCIATCDKELVALYNKTANAYNAAASKIIFSNFQNPSQMATTKKAAAVKETPAAATPTKTAATTKAAAKTKAQPAAPEEVAEEKPLSQKETVIQEAEAGLSVDQIVEKHGFKKTNVSWYFSQHKLHTLPAQVERKAAEVAAKIAAKAATAPAAAAQAPAPTAKATGKKAASAQK